MELLASALHPEAADRRKDAAARDASDKEDVQWVMGNARGRRFLARLLADAGVFRSSMADAAERIAFNEGQRNAGLRLLSILTSAAPDEYLIMEKERISNGRS